MARSCLRARRKVSGGRYKNIKGKKLKDLAGEPALTKIGDVKARIKKIRGGYTKKNLLFGNVANIYDPKTKKYIKAKIESVKDNSANRHFVRRNIITKGAIIKTDKGDAMVKSRPGQSGVIDAVLVSS